MLFASFGFEITEAELREACDCTRLGTDAWQAVEAARRLGFPRTAKYTLDLTELTELVGRGVYPIVLVNLLPIDGIRETHALVVIDISQVSIEVLDPAKGTRTFPLDVFSTAWRMRHHLAIVIER